MRLSLHPLFLLSLAVVLAVGVAAPPPPIIGEEIVRLPPMGQDVGIGFKTFFDRFRAKLLRTRAMKRLISTLASSRTRTHVPHHASVATELPPSPPPSPRLTHAGRSSESARELHPPRPRVGVDARFSLDERRADRDLMPGRLRVIVDPHSPRIVGLRGRMEVVSPKRQPRGSEDERSPSPSPRMKSGRRRTNANSRWPQIDGETARSLSFNQVDKGAEPRWSQTDEGTSRSLSFNQQVDQLASRRRDRDLIGAGDIRRTLDEEPVQGAREQYPSDSFPY